MTITLKENIIQKGGAAKEKGGAAKESNVSKSKPADDYWTSESFTNFMNYWYTAHSNREDLIKYTTDNYNKFIVDNFKGNEDHLKSHMEKFISKDSGHTKPNKKLDKLNKNFTTAIKDKDTGKKIQLLSKLALFRAVKEETNESDAKLKNLISALSTNKLIEAKQAANNAAAAASSTNLETASQVYKDTFRTRYNKLIQDLAAAERAVNNENTTTSVKEVQIGELKEKAQKIILGSKPSNQSLKEIKEEFEEIKEEFEEIKNELNNFKNKHPKPSESEEKKNQLLNKAIDFTLKPDIQHYQSTEIEKLIDEIADMDSFDEIYKGILIEEEAKRVKEAKKKNSEAGKSSTYKREGMPGDGNCLYYSILMSSLRNDLYPGNFYLKDNPDAHRDSKEQYDYILKEAKKIRMDDDNITTQIEQLIKAINDDQEIANVTEEQKINLIKKAQLSNNPQSIKYVKIKTINGEETIEDIVHNFKKDLFITYWNEIAFPVRNRGSESLGENEKWKVDIYDYFNDLFHAAQERAFREQEQEKGKRR